MRLPLSLSVSWCGCRFFRAACAFYVARKQHLQYNVDVPVQCIDEGGGADVVKVFVGSTRSCVPLISAAVSMPMSEVASG